MMYWMESHKCDEENGSLFSRLKRKRRGNDNDSNEICATTPGNHYSITGL